MVDILNSNVEDKYKDDITKDYGLYQIYGHHFLHGTGTLLSIGKADKYTFRSILRTLEKRIIHEASDITIYLGRLGGIQNKKEIEVSNRIYYLKKNNLKHEYDDFSQYWSKCIDDAEKLLIYFCNPPYNSSDDEMKIRDTIVLNFGKRNKLPPVFSSLYSDSMYWKEKNGDVAWKCFIENKVSESVERW